MTPQSLKDRNHSTGAGKIDLLKKNKKKTTEMTIDYRTKPSIKAPILIVNQSITITDSFKFFGTHIVMMLKWNLNTNHQIQKAKTETLLSTRPILHSHDYPEQPVTID